ncbi:hypothetical protein [Salinibacter altiplanensis]|uniref:hypothetical protein n=1 Tax=Salinibacter altiplanensis TaxID=1803181 RepID=UPI001F3D1E62|nr:hypothetical protein [Salinibacter altiplanensis]
MSCSLSLGTTVRFTRGALGRWAVVGLLLVLGVLGSSVHAQAPDTSQGPVYRVETADGQVLRGTLVSETDGEVVLDVRQLGEVTIQRTNIERLEELDPGRLRDGEYWFQNPQSTRYFFAPNALEIPKGEGYYQNTWILFNNVNYGATDHFSVGAGTIPIFLFGAEALPIWFLPKVSIPMPRDDVHLAGGAVFGGVLGAGDSEGAGLVYGSATVGGRDHNVTVGLGYGYTDGGFADRPGINVSGMTRVGRTTYLITENYFFPGVDDANLISFGVRWAPENFAVDVALARPLETEGDFIGLPWLGVTIPFGQ